MINLNFVYSEIFLSLAIMSMLLIGVFRNKSSNIVYNLSILSLAILFVINFNLFNQNDVSLFDDGYKIEFLSTFMKLLIIH